jgi:hypothetical protein
MSLSLAIAVNAVLDLGILGALAFAVSRARTLRPHGADAASLAAAVHPAQAAVRPRRDRPRAARELAPARS